MIVRAQLTADFTADRIAGCSPLTITFTNTTTGASTNTTWSWDFGNTKTSTLFNAGTIYLDEQTYTVTLTARDGLQTSVKKMQVMLYKKPVVDFSASPAMGCQPLPVNFSSSSTAGDGEIANYFWDFGDGAIQQGTALSQIGHVYNFVQTANVSLTITNSHGCYHTLIKPAVVIAQPVAASFHADKTVLCQITDAVQFTNTSTGGGTLSYLWDFGDGSTSADKDPTHVFSKKGIYSIRLTVSSPGGCQDIGTKTDYINAANFTADFSIPSLICKGTTAVFSDNSIPAATSGEWQFGDGNNSTTYGGGPVSHLFNTTGQQTIILTNSFGTCPQTVSKQVYIHDEPYPQGFLSEPAGACGAPINVNFRDTTTGAVQWKWSFAPQSSAGPSTSLQSISHYYETEGLFTVPLTVTNADGCSNTTSKIVSTYKPAVFISWANSTSPKGNSGCGDFSMDFAASSNSDPITSYKWDFGDGGISANPAPQHHFSIPGTYIVHLGYTTKNGCEGIAEYSSIHLYQKPVADFVVLPGTTICGDNPVSFSDRSKGPVSELLWNLGDNTGYFPSPGPGNRYYNKGTYTITLIATNEFCSDTMIKKDYITVFPPFPKIGGAVGTCDDTRGMVSFSQTSKEAIGWAWDFGDGSPALSLNTDEPTLQHLYMKTGVYKVVLSTTNGQCTVKDSTGVAVLLRQHPILKADQKEICASDFLNVSISGFELNPFPPSYYYNYGYTFAGWQYGDLSPFTGTVSPAGIDYRLTTYNGTFLGLTNGKDSLRAILLSSGLGCADTTNFIPLKIKGPVADYSVGADNTCYKSPIILKDNSHGTNDVPIKTWTWSYGDGQTESADKGGSMLHFFTVPGVYYPDLSVQDGDGCYATAPSVKVRANGPKADFYYQPTAVSPNTIISFNNTTNNTGVISTQYQWDFGDGSQATGYYASHSYPLIGEDTVRLIAQSPAPGCTDTAWQVVYVKTIHTSFTYTTSYINNNSCPPVVVRFVNQSVNASKISWDFGDGSSADDQDLPSHTYDQPGIYKVVLYGVRDNKEQDSTAMMVTVNGPYAQLKADLLSGCTGQTVTLSATVRNASSFTWDFADGALGETRDTFAVHQYLTGGLYTPALIMKDANGCSATSSLQQHIIIDSMHVGIKNMPGHVCISTGISLDPFVESIASDELQQALQYKWNFGTGVPADTSDAISGQFIYREPGRYLISLTVVSPYGCVRELTHTLLVASPQPFRLKVAADTFACPGLPFQLKAQGAASYSWINATGLDNSLLADPVATPPLQAAYTVVGYDPYQCFSDTATVKIRIAPLPSVSTGPDREIPVLTGSAVNLSAAASSDVTEWNWSPPDFLSCTDCPSPASMPRSSISYMATVKNQYGCTASDTVSLKLICDNSRVYISNGFTPNGDGKNDVFYIKGKGIRTIKYLRIFNRWGELIFERANFNIDDRSAGWDGSFKGRLVEAGTYVYLTELVCDSGEVFPIKGTLTIIR